MLFKVGKDDGRRRGKEEKEEIMLIRVVELEDRKWFRLEMEKPTNVILGTFVSKEESLKFVDDLVAKLKELGWDCAYDKDAEVLACRPRLVVEVIK